MTEKQFNKLPKWAKEEICRCGHEIKKLNGEIERLNLSNVGTGKVILDPYSNNPKHLKENTTVRFNDEINVRIFEDNSIRIFSDDLLQILPGGSNTARLKSIK